MRKCVRLSAVGFSALWPLDARGLALTACALVACGTTPPTGPTATVPPVRLSVSVTVANARLGTAVPSDFTVTVRNNLGFSTEWHGAKDILVPGNGSYDVSVTAAPDGYAATRSPSCSAATVPRQTLPPCVITATELPLACDDTLWAPTYSRDRLKILSNCEIATGFVERSNLEHDGDLVLRILPDPPYRGLLREGNGAIQNSLVVEIPCQGPIDQGDAMGACDHFQRRTVQPAVGAHIAVAAHHVQDRNHGMWAELHGANLRVLAR